MSREEAIKLLEGIKVVPAKDDSEGNTCCIMRVTDYIKIDRAFAELKQQPEPTEFRKKVVDVLEKEKEGVFPQCCIDLLKEACTEIEKRDVIIGQQAEPPEFTKTIRGIIDEHLSFFGDDPAIFPPVNSQDIIKLCVIIDQQAEGNKKLKRLFAVQHMAIREKVSEECMRLEQELDKL